MKVGHSQITFERTYAIGDAQVIGRCVQQTNDNGYIIACSGYNSSQGLMIKTNEYGDTSWCKVYYHEKNISFISVVQTDDGGYAMTGYWREKVQPYRLSLCIVKIDEYGEELWSKDYYWDDHYIGYSIKQTEDNGFVITGKGDVVDIDANTFLMKTDMNGDSLWTKIYTWTPYRWGGNEVLVSSAGGYVIVGGERWEDEMSDAFLLRTDENGNILWTKTYNLSYSEAGISIHELEGEGYLISGEVSYSYQGNPDLFLMKIDLQGDAIWTEYYGNTDYEFGGWSHISSDGSIYLTGSKYVSGQGYKVFIINADSIGEMKWIKEYTGVQSYFIQATNDGGSVVTGYAYDPDENPLVYLLKTDESGVVTWIKPQSMPPNDKFNITPNPIKNDVTISFQLWNSSEIILNIYNQKGQMIQTLYNGFKNDGFHQLIWQAETLHSGIYFMRLQTDYGCVTKKIIKQ
jgi:hypothetical protein